MSLSFILWIGTQYVPQLHARVWECTNWEISIELYQGNDCGILGNVEMGYCIEVQGGRWPLDNKADAQHMVVAYVKGFEPGRTISLVMYDLVWGLEIRCISSCQQLIRMHLCPLILNVSPVGVRSIGIFSSIDCLMIGIWIHGLLYSKMLWNTGSNRMRWSLHGTRVLDVKSYCGVLHALWEICFHGEGFGMPKLRRGLLFSCGQQNGENYRLMIILE